MRFVVRHMLLARRSFSDWVPSVPEEFSAAAHTHNLFGVDSL